uniref:Uncharacterized protein n=1 Tax=Anguilla anguilla TaxID=7936 RepID=A0A0E9RW60_ANGAN
MYQFRNLLHVSSQCIMFISNLYMLFF